MACIPGFRTVVFGILVLATCRWHCGDARAEPPRPNIVFFYADDLGFGDLACYGSDVARSPRLDALASEGTRFTQFYVSHCVCSPTRASAITGHFPGRHGIHAHLSFFTANRVRNMPDWLDVNAPSLPRALQQSAYRTAMIGKWHLGGGSGRTFQISDLKNPNIDTSKRTKIVINHPDAPPVSEYGFHYARTTVGNGPTWKHLEPWPEAHDIYPYMSSEWLTWSSRAIADDTIRFLERHARDHRDHPFYINVWFKDVHTPFKPTKEMLRPFLHLDENARFHYAMVHYMDSQIGRVLDALNELELSRNTLVVFSSDNGAAKGRGGSNGPLLGWKHTLYEGGIRVPLIVRWPEGGVAAGRVDRDSVLNICDFVPTFSRLAGADMGADYESDGEDMLTALRGKTFQRTQPQFWFYPSSKPSLAMRDGNWKLLANSEGDGLQLYDLSRDSAESTNLAEKQTDRVATMRRRLLDWYGRIATVSNQKGQDSLSRD